MSATSSPLVSQFGGTAPAITAVCFKPLAVNPGLMSTQPGIGSVNHFTTGGSLHDRSAEYRGATRGQTRSWRRLQPIVSASGTDNGRSRSIPSARPPLTFNRLSA
jgi:hypothetical protein